MFGTRCILRNKKFLGVSTYYKVEKVSHLHIATTQRWRILEKRTNTCSQYHIILGHVPATRYLSTSADESTFTVITPGKNETVGKLASSPKVGDGTLSSSVETSSKLSTTSEATGNVVSNTVTESGAKVVSSSPLPPVPEPPVRLEGVIDTLSEPPFSSIGLGGWSPVGLIQSSFEYLHINCDIPWWTCIMIGTVVVRTLMFPLVIMTQKNAAKMSNNMPKFQEIQSRINEARNRGEAFEAARYTQDLMLFMREKNISPIKNMITPLAQAPLFISFFMALREMANTPVKSLHNGGLFWFTDLTVPDQFYLLPLFTSLTMWLTIEVGTDGKLSGPNIHLMKYVLRGVPVVMFPFIMNFPGAILVYWCSTNTISLIQVFFLRIPKVRNYFKIEAVRKVDEAALNAEKKPFVQMLKKWWKDTRTQSKIGKTASADKGMFLNAGRGAIKKTYKYNPTLPRPVSAAPSASVHTKKA